MRYVALLRGINVSGANMIKMDELRRTFEGLGFKDVVSYINSGNLAFDTRSTSEDSLAAKIEKAIHQSFGMTIPVMIRQREHIGEVLANNPFEGEYESHKEMHVLFLKEPLSKDSLEEVRAGAPKDERFAAKGREIYLHLPMGVAESVLGRGLIEKKLKVAVTARNWRTVQKLAEL
ncbi:MAG: hypothetical protein DCC44_06320 [Acidobacteria bacterium]|nr:hypothetical protein [Pyrinomonadaceae bacterium]RIJ93737.1 MAG: hypothetical protein DCC44_06320 [Acidobacteriota bacterium]